MIRTNFLGTPGVIVVATLGRHELLRARAKFSEFVHKVKPTPSVASTPWAILIPLKEVPTNQNEIQVGQTLSMALTRSCHLRPTFQNHHQLLVSLLAKW